MEWWISAGTASTLFVIAGWLVRQLLVTRLTKSVEGEFNRALEKYRAELRVSEEHLKSQLKARETDVSALRSSAIASIANRQTKLDDRKLQAVDDIWNAVIELAPAKFISGIMVSFNFEEMAKAAVTDPKVREIICLFDKNLELANLKHKVSPEKSRPFVTPMLWASYSAYSAILMQAVMRAYAIKSGVGARDFMDDEKVSTLLKTVLPHQENFVAKFGPSGYHHLVEEIETKIIKEMHLTISGEDSNEASLRQAAKILEQSHALHAATIATPKPREAP